MILSYGFYVYFFFQMQKQKPNHSLMMLNQMKFQSVQKISIKLHLDMILKPNVRHHQVPFYWEQMKLATISQSVTAVLLKQTKE